MACVGGIVEPRLHRVDIDLPCLDLTEQHEVVALTVDRVREDGAIRKRFEERRDLALHGRVRALVQLHEQRHHATGIEVALDHLEELARVERCSTLHPRIERIRRNRIELLVRRQQVMPGIVQVNLDLRVRDDVEVVLGEVRGDDARNERLDLGDGLILDHRVDRHRAGRHSGAAADHQHLRGRLRDERGDVAEHPLQPHVLRLARRLDLAGVVIVQHAAGSPRDGD